MREPETNDSTRHVFTDHELERLKSYKAAIAAGLWGDALTDAETPHWDDLGLPPVSAEPVSMYDRFTPGELARIAAYKAAVDAGFYHEDGPATAIKEAES